MDQATIDYVNSLPREAIGDNIKKVIIGIIATLGFLFIIAGGKVAASMMLGVATIAGFIVIFTQLPIFLKKIVARFHLIFDALFTIMAYKLFGSHTATALQGAAICGIGMSLYLLRQRRLLLGKEHQMYNMMHQI
jgi:hypothetical protein